MSIFQTGAEILQIGVELNNYCNLDCRHCLRELKAAAKNFPPELLRKILREARPLGAKVVGFTGGEPTLHPRLDEILDVVCEEGYRYYFVTNAGRFEKFLPRLLARRDLLAGISFSLDGAAEETHDFIRGSGSFRHVMAAVAACHGEGIPFNLQMCLNTRNKGEIGEMALLAAELGAQHLFYAHLMPTPHLVSMGLLLSPEECRKAEDEVNRLKPRFAFDIYMAVGYHVGNPFFHCRAQSMNALNFDFAGNLTVCCQLSNYRAPGGESASKLDVMGSMGEMSLLEGTVKLRQLLNRFFEEKGDRVRSGKFREVDHFPCVYCAKWYGKVEWLKEIPENRWN